MSRADDGGWRQAVDEHRETLEALADLDVEGVAELSDAARALLAEADEINGG